MLGLKLSPPHNFLQIQNPRSHIVYPPKSSKNPYSIQIKPQNPRKFPIYAENPNKNDLNNANDNKEKTNFNGNNNDEGKNEGLGLNWNWNWNWGKLILDPDPDNLLAVGLTGLLTWASVQVLWQLVVVSFAIVVAGLKYSIVAALLIFILIALL